MIKELAEGYAQALLGALKEGKRDAVLKIFFALLQKKGHRSLLPRILRALESASKEKSPARVLVASEDDFAAFKKEIAMHTEEMHIERFEKCVDPAVIGGYRIESGHVLFDNSYKRHLTELYKAITR